MYTTHHTKEHSYKPATSMTPTGHKENYNQKHKHRLHLLFVRLYTLVQFDNMAANKPDQVAEVRDCCLVSDIVQHVLVVHWRKEGQDQICY